MLSDMWALTFYCLLLAMSGIESTHPRLLLHEVSTSDGSSYIELRNTDPSQDIVLDDLSIFIMDSTKYRGSLKLNIRGVVNLNGKSIAAGESLVFIGTPDELENNIATFGTVDTHYPPSSAYSMSTLFKLRGTCIFLPVWKKLLSCNVIFLQVINKMPF